MRSRHGCSKHVSISIEWIDTGALAKVASGKGLTVGIGDHHDGEAGALVAVVRQAVSVGVVDDGSDSSAHLAGLRGSSTATKEDDDDMR